LRNYNIKSPFWGRLWEKEEVGGVGCGGGGGGVVVVCVIEERRINYRKIPSIRPSLLWVRLNESKTSPLWYKTPPSPYFGSG